MKVHGLLIILLFTLMACGTVGKIEPPQPIYTRTPAPNPTIPPSAVPPNPSSNLSDGESVRLFMLSSHTRWQSLWADAQIDDYGTAGSTTPVQSTHLQVWIAQPAQFRVLSGPAGGAPTDILVSDGNNLRQQGGTISPLPPSVREPFSPPTTLSDTVYPHPLGGMLGTPLGDLLYPAGLAQRQGTYQVIGHDMAAGREAVLLDWSYTPGAVADRLWVDAETGVLLRMQNFGKGGQQGLQTDYSINQIIFNESFPVSVFLVNSLLPPAFATDASDIP
jgi:hypothetical protein